MPLATRYELFARKFRASLRCTISPPAIFDGYSFRDEYSSLYAIPSSYTYEFFFKDPFLCSLAGSSVDVEDAFDGVWETSYPRRKLPESIEGEIYEVFCQQ